ncbi:MAG: ATP-grasp domain-containing protein [Deltaproteobacteria bacterium]|nr:ATP-grasp domain-containing protein [Deltaproteobacteria bacterium]
MRIALATCESLADLFPSDKLLADCLRATGHEVAPWVWTRPRPDSLDGIVIRTTWDYWHRADAFRSWLESLRDVPVLNSVDTLLWNLDKRYLHELAEAGVTIPRTEFHSDRFELGPTMDRMDLERVVIKPAISAGGDDTFVVERPAAAAEQHEIDRLTDRGILMVQEFLPEIADGELSLVYLGGEYSHTVRKRAAAGEFRIHVEHGGTVESDSPDQRLIEAADRVVASLPEVPAYARVDGVVRNDTLVLMELELIEPELFFDYSEGSAQRFAAVIETRLAD